MSVTLWLACSLLSSPQGLSELEVMNPPGTSYLDPELHPTAPEMVYQTPSGVWVGELDLDTGLFVSQTGQDRFVDTASSLTQSKNGPEYGLDSNGVSIFYNKTEGPGIVRIWRATENVNQTGFLRSPLTGFDTDRINQLVSQDADSPSTFVLYARDDQPSMISYFDELTPQVESDVTPVAPGFAGFRWGRDSTILTSTISTGADAGQIVMIDASDGTQRVITNDSGIKFDPYPWYAPEFGGALAVCAVVNGIDVAVYVDLGGPFFDRVSLLERPKTRMTHAQSQEPFVAGGRSFISLTLKDDPGSIYTDVTESQIWIYGIFDGPGRYVRRCDDGQPGRIRHEAETLSGNSETFLYYNELLPSGLFTIVRCRTGMPR